MWNRQLKEYIKTFLQNNFPPQVVMFLVMMMFAGVFWGFIEVTITNSNTMTFRRFWLFLYQAFLFWFLDDLGAKKLDMGWTVRLLYFFLMQFFCYRCHCCFPLLLFNRHLTGDGWNVDLAALPHLLRPDHGHDRPHQRHRHRHARLLCKTSWLQLPWGLSFTVLVIVSHNSNYLTSC